MRKIDEMTHAFLVFAVLVLAVPVNAQPRVREMDRGTNDKAEGQLANGDYRGAISTLNSVFEVHGDDSWMRSFAYMKLLDWRAAASEYTRLIELFTGMEGYDEYRAKLARALNNRAICLNYLGDFSAAKGDALMAIELDGSEREYKQSFLDIEKHESALAEREAARGKLFATAVLVVAAGALVASERSTGKQARTEVLALGQELDRFQRGVSDGACVRFWSKFVTTTYCEGYVSRLFVQSGQAEVIVARPDSTCPAMQSLPVTRLTPCSWDAKKVKAVMKSGK